jgi:hypothetical protein
MKIEFLDIRHRFGVKNFKVYVAFIIVTVWILQNGKKKSLDINVNLFPRWNERTQILPFV